MKNKGYHLVMTEFGKIYLTPISRYEIYAQTFWPVRPLKVGHHEVYVAMRFLCSATTLWTLESTMRLDELPGRRPFARSQGACVRGTHARGVGMGEPKSRYLGASPTPCRAGVHQGASVPTRSTHCGERSDARDGNSQGLCGRGHR